MPISEKEQSYLEGSLMPQVKFLQDLYYLALARYKLVEKYAKNKIVLDAGCGSGYGAYQLAQADAKKVYGVDIIPESIKYCQAHHTHKNLIFKQADLTKLDFPDGFFDVIVAFEVIEHIKDYSKAIAEIYRVLKPEGLIILSTPNKAIYSPDSKKPFYPFHYHEFYLKDLKKMLKKFEIKKILGEYIKGRKLLLYSRWNPKRYVRIIFANLPFVVKVWITRIYIKIYFWLYRKKLYRPVKIKLSDVYFSKNLDKTRAIVIMAQKPRGGK